MTSDRHMDKAEVSKRRYGRRYSRAERARRRYRLRHYQRNQRHPWRRA